MSFKSSTRRALTFASASAKISVLVLLSATRRTQTSRKTVVVVVQVLLRVERHQTLENTVANTTSTNGTNDLALQVVGVASNLGYHPVTTLDHLVRRDEVSDEQEDAHDDMFSDGGDIRARDLEDLDLALDRGVEVDVVGTNTSSDTDFQVLGLE